MIEVYAGADFAFRSDHAAVVVISRHKDFYNFLDADEIAPSRGNPLTPSVVCARFATFLQRFNVYEVATDQHYVESVREHMASHGIAIREIPSTNAEKVAGYLGLKSLIGEARIRIAHPGLAQQLKAIRKRPLAGGGLDIQQPRRRGSGHADLVSATVAAVWLANQTPGGGGPGIAEMNRYERQAPGYQGYGRWWDVGGRGF